jgi:hypothetical protein
MAKGKTYVCSCCGSEVTAPYFFKGGVYGYTCIKKVNPTAKKVKDAGLWATYQELVIEQPEADRQRFAVSVVSNGKTFFIGYGYSEDGKDVKGIATSSKLFQIAEQANGCKPLFKSPVIVTEQQTDGTHVVNSVLINGLPA